METLSKSFLECNRCHDTLYYSGQLFFCKNKQCKNYGWELSIQSTNANNWIRATGIYDYGTFLNYLNIVEKQMRNKIAYDRRIYEQKILSTMNETNTKNYEEGNIEVHNDFTNKIINLFYILLGVLIIGGLLNIFGRNILQ